MTIIQFLFIALAGYAIGNFSPSYLIGRKVGKIDIREAGSGNAGATNVMRVLGWKYGLLVFVLDMLKGLAAASIGLWLGKEAGMAAASIGVILGHDFPALLDFRGGKGIASTTGIFLSLFPLPTLVGILVFVAVVLLTRMVSVGSMVFVLSMAVYTVATHQPIAFIILAVLVAAFAIFRHQENIRRILRGVENKISIGKKVSPQPR
jgi:glycerol-3-phosphate acyltransferase PlsY